MGLKKPQARKMPTLGCLGYLSNLEDARLSQSGKYYVMPFELTGKYGSRSTRGNILFLPEWFEPDFNPLALESPFEDVYRMHIAGRGGVSTLEGLCASETASNDLAEALYGLSAYTPEAISDTLIEFYQNLGTLTLGYNLKQKVEKLDDGSTERSERYELGGFWYVTEDAIERAVVRQERSNANPDTKYPYRLGFDLKQAGIVVAAH